MSDDFSARYRLLKCVLVEDGIRTHNAQELAGGRVVMVHITDAAGPEEVDALRVQLAALPTVEKNKVLEAVTLASGFAVVTEFLPAPLTFRGWLAANAGSAPTDALVSRHTPTRSMPAAALPVEGTMREAADDEAGNDEGHDAGIEAGPAANAPVPLHGTAESFSAIFGTPTPAAPGPIEYPLPSSSHLSVDLSTDMPTGVPADVSIEVAPVAPPQPSPLVEQAGDQVTSSAPPAPAPAPAAAPAAAPAPRPKVVFVVPPSAPVPPVPPVPQAPPVAPMMPPVLPPVMPPVADQVVPSAFPPAVPPSSLMGSAGVTETGTPIIKAEPGEFTKMFAPSADSEAIMAPLTAQIPVTPTSPAPPTPSVPAGMPLSAPLPPPTAAESMGFSSDLPAAAPPRQPPGEFTLMFGAPETAAPMPESVRPSPMRQAPPPAFSPLTPERRLESPPVEPMHRAVTSNPSYVAGIQQDGLSPIAPDIVGGGRYGGLPPLMPPAPPPPAQPAHVSPLFAAAGPPSGEAPPSGFGILPPPIFSSGTSSPLSALGGAAPLVNASAGPSDFTRLITGAAEPVVPTLAPTAAMTPGARTSGGRRVPNGLIITINAVLLIAALLMFFVLRRPVPTAQQVMPARPVLPTMPTAPQVPTKPPGR